MEYIAPIKEIQFLVQQAAQQAGLQHIESLDDFDVDMVNAILDEAAKFANNVLAPTNVIGDHKGCHFADGVVTTPDEWKTTFNEYCQNGWLGMNIPIEYGGQQLPNVITQPINDMWHSSNLAFLMFHAVAQGTSQILRKYGTEEQCQRYIENLATGKWTCSMSLTEPAAGSDLGEIKTKAIPQADGSYLIKGQKIYITYGEHDMAENIVHFVLAKTPDAPSGSRGISLFVVPKYRINADGTLGEANDIVCTGIEHKLGLKGSPTCSMSYGDNNACFGELVGEENKGLQGMFLLMNEARLSVGLQGVALSELGYQKALSYALERAQGVHYETGEKRIPIVQHPDVARMLMSMKSFIVGQRSLAYLIGALIDKSEYCEDKVTSKAAEDRVALLTPIFKAFATEQGNRMAGLAVQVFGGMGFVEETGVAQVMRDIRITTIYEGTTGVQAKDLLFRKIRGDNGAALTALLADMRSTADKLTSQSRLAGLGVSLKTAIAEFETALPSVLRADANLLQLNAGSVPLLEAIGFLTTVWQLGEVCLAVVAADNQEDFFQNYLALAEFYCAYSLPEMTARMTTFARADAGIASFNFHA